MVILVIALLFTTIVILGILLYFALDTMRYNSNLFFRELVASRHNYTRIFDEQRIEIHSLTESLARTESKIYISPVESRVNSEIVPPPQPSAFRFKPNPPFVRFVPPDTQG